MKNRIKHIMRPALFSAGLVLAATSCIDENSLCVEDRPGYQEGNDVWLAFSVKNQNTSDVTSRAGEPTDPTHPDESASDIENYIDPSDVTIMLADNKGNIWKVWNAATGDLVAVEGTNNQYEYIARINQEYFNYAEGDNIDFSFIIVANTRGCGADNDSYDENDFMKTPWGLSKEYRGFTFNPGWTPSETDKHYIPMSGLIKASVTRTALEGATDTSNALNIGTIYMQRNLCKVRILGDLNGLEGGSEYNQITSVKLTGVNSKGAFIPVVEEGTDSWYGGTKVVETPTEKPEWWSGTTEVEMIAAPQTSVIYGETYDNAFYCYVPEAMLADRDAKLTITANYKEDPNSTKVWELPLAQPYGSGDNIYKGTTSFVRNHIYEYRIQAQSGAKLTLTLNVLDWQAETITWDYSDNPGVADGGWLTWTAEMLNGATVNTNTARLVFGSDETKTATGTFQFSQPLGGTWTASFAPQGNTETNAFCFVAPDGSLVDVMSGSISEGVKSSIQIRPRYVPAQQRSAQLIFTVRTPDGRTLTGDLVEGDIKHFTVVQNAQ